LSGDARINLTLLSRIENGNLEQIKLADVILLAEHLEQGGHAPGALLERRERAEAAQSEGMIDAPRLGERARFRL
jgi:hypothetical protein